MCTVLMGNSSQVLIKKKEKKTDLFGNFESINLCIHPSQTWQTCLLSYAPPVSETRGNLRMKIPRLHVN